MTKQKLNKANFKIEFDNGGGAVFESRSYAHHYNCGETLAETAYAFMLDSNTSGWDFNEKQDGVKITNHWTSTTQDRSEVMAFKFDDESAYENISGYTERDFYKALAKLLA
jgi:hypothetical protein